MLNIEVINRKPQQDDQRKTPIFCAFMVAFMERGAGMSIFYLILQNTVSSPML